MEFKLEHKYRIYYIIQILIHKYIYNNNKIDQAWLKCDKDTQEQHIYYLITICFLT